MDEFDELHIRSVGDDSEFGIWLRTVWIPKARRAENFIFSNPNFSNNQTLVNCNNSNAFANWQYWRSHPVEKLWADEIIDAFAYLVP